LFTFEDDFEGGGLMFSDGSNSASGDPKMIRKATREQAKDVEMVDADPILNNLNRMAKIGPKNKPRGNGKTNATTKSKPNLASNFKKGVERGKKIVKQAEFINKVKDKAGSLKEANSNEPDTTLITNVPAGIEVNGTFKISKVKKDTTVVKVSKADSVIKTHEKAVNEQHNKILK